MIRHLLFFLFIVHPVFLFAQSDHDKELHEVNSLMFNYKLDKTKLYLENHFLKSPKKSRQIIGYVYLAQYYQYSDDINTTNQLKSLEKARTISKQTNYELDEAYVNYGYAMYYKSINRWDYYVKYLLKSIETFQKYPNENFNLAKLYISKYRTVWKNMLERPKVDDYEKALSYAKLSSNDILIGSVYLDLGTYYISTESNLKKAESYFKKSYDLSLKLKDEDTKKTFSFYYYSNIGQIYGMNGEYKKAIETFYKGVELMDLEKDSYYLCGLYNNMGRTYFFMGETETALNYYKKAEKYSQDKDISSFNRIAINTNIYEAYEKLNQLDKALVYLKKAKDDIIAEDKKQYDYQSQSLENFYKTEEQNNLLNEQNKSYKIQKKYLIGIISLSILSISALIFMLNFRKKLSKQRLQFMESEKERLQIQNELSTLKKEHLQKQVLATSIQLEQKNKFLNELIENIKNDKDFNLKSFLKNEKILDKELNNIHEIIKEVHPNFIKNLNIKAKNKLTNLDIKYASYIYMNMDNSQIASVLNVDPKTVSVTKYRLKQKLGLEKEIDLDTFLRSSILLDSI